MKYDLKDTINAALMTQTPVAIVEGYDDIKFYSNIALEKSLNLDVKAIETIEDYGEGCEQVIKAVDDATQLIQNDSRLKKYVVGIIDRDIRQYRGTIPVYDNIIILKYYSYETHLITPTTITKLIEYIAKVPKALINQDVIDYISANFVSKYLERLYYFSLEALKTSCDSSYRGEVTYDAEPGSLTGRGGDHFESLVFSKKAILDQFASQKSNCKDEIKNIAKGKWYLRFWSHYLQYHSKDFHNLCGHQFPKCDYCLSGKHEKCLWKVNCRIDNVTMESLLPTSQYLDYNEISYIADALKLKLDC